MKTFIYYIAERIPGQQEMQRFAHPIHVGMLSAEHVADAYELVCADLTPTFADHPQALEIRFEEMAPPRSGGAGARSVSGSTSTSTSGRPGGTNEATATQSSVM